MLLWTDEMYPVTFERWVTSAYAKNFLVPGKYIPVHTFTKKFDNVHTWYILVRKSCTCTYNVHTISYFSYRHVPVHTLYVLVRTFSEGFVQGVRFPDGLLCDMGSIINFHHDVIPPMGSMWSRQCTMFEAHSYPLWCTCANSSWFFLQWRGLRRCLPSMRFGDWPVVELGGC